MRRFGIFLLTLVLAMVEPAMITTIIIFGIAFLQATGIPTGQSVWITIVLLGVPLSIAGLMSIRGVRKKLAR